MLTADLVQARIYKKKVRPRYVKDRDPELLDLAGQLIATFDAYQGRPRHELDAELEEILGSDTDVLLHRALAKLLVDRCQFEASSPVEPEILRQTVFRTAAAAYRADPDDEAFTFDREATMTAAADQLELSTDTVEQALYADLKTEQVLTEWRPCEPDWLLRRYNTALAQGVLLRATELRLEIGAASPEQHRALFRQIKFFQLMHRVSRRPPTDDGAAGGWWMTLDGPASLFKASGKYGVRMASFLPTLLHFDDWSAEADVRWGPKRRPCTFELTSAQGLRPHTRLTGQWQPEEIAAFPDRFSALDSPWSVSTDDELVDLGGEGVLVPDWVFTHRPSGRRVVMEIFGFWRKGAIDSRIRLLRRHGPEHLILALSSQLATGREGLDDLPGEIYVFRSQPVPRKVLKVLDSFLA
ncbi:MAG: DUF790 family protein [Acidobacteriota bacterium]